MNKILYDYFKPKEIGNSPRQQMIKEVVPIYFDHSILKNTFHRPLYFRLGLQLCGYILPKKAFECMLEAFEHNALAITDIDKDDMFVENFGSTLYIFEWEAISNYCILINQDKHGIIPGTKDYLYSTLTIDEIKFCCNDDNKVTVDKYCFVIAVLKVCIATIHCLQQSSIREQNYEGYDELFMADSILWDLYSKLVSNKNPGVINTIVNTLLQKNIINNTSILLHEHFNIN